MGDGKGELRESSEQMDFCNVGFVGCSKSMGKKEVGRGSGLSAEEAGGKWQKVSLYFK
jgi:hypothetical protein